MKTLIRDFLRDEAGAVTFDWVVLAAAVVVLSWALVSTIGSGVVSLSSDTSTTIATTAVG